MPVARALGCFYELVDVTPTRKSPTLSQYKFNNSGLDKKTRKPSLDSDAVLRRSRKSLSEASRPSRQTDDRAGGRLGRQDGSRWGKHPADFVTISCAEVGFWASGFL